MTDYVKIVDFAAKDSLVTGNPAKLARGTEIDNELNAIVSAIATKENIGSKGIGGGYAELDGSALVPVAQLPQATTTAKGAVELATSAEAVTGTSTTLVPTCEAVAAAIAAAGVSAASILSKLVTVDGASSGLDADLLDGNHAAAFALASHNHSASQITSGLSGTYAPLASPALTGTPTSTTAASGTSNTQIATTAFATGTFSHNPSGYEIRPSGLYEQWGSTYIGNASQGQNAAISFPIAFPTAVYVVMATLIDTSGNYSTILIVNNYTLSTFTYIIGETAAIVQDCSVMWYALGK